MPVFENYTLVTVEISVKIRLKKAGVTYKIELSIRQSVKYKREKKNVQ